MKRLLVRGASKVSSRCISLILFAALMLGAVSAFGSTVRWTSLVQGNGNYSLALGNDGTIYVCTRDSHTDSDTLYAFNPNGTQRWTRSGLRGTPTIGPDGKIYVGSGSSEFYSYDSNGTRQWTFPTCYGVQFNPSVGPDGTIYVAAGSYNANNGIGMFYAVNPDGTQKWAYEIAGMDSVGSSPAIGPDGTIYVGIKAGSNTDRVYAFNPDGTLKWISQDDFGSMAPSFAIAVDGTIYCGSSLGLYAINPDNGSNKWGAPIGNQYQSSPVIAAGGTIYVGSTDHKLYAVNPNGTVKWQFQTGGQVNSTPSIASNGVIYVGSWDENLYAVNWNGTEKWSCDIGGNSVSCPAIGPDGTIYTVHYDSLGNHYVVAVNGDGNTLATNTPWPTLGRNSQHTGNLSPFIADLVSPVGYQVVQGDSVVFTWKGIQGVQTYLFEIADNPGFVNPFSQNVNQTAISLSGGFTAGRQYFWRVGVESDFTDTGYSKVGTFIYKTPLAHPLIFAPDFGATVSTAVTLSWGFPGATKFGLQIATDPGFTQLKFSNYVTFTSGTINCEPGTTYYWRVLPCDDNSQPLGTWSHSYRFTTSAP